MCKGPRRETFTSTDVPWQYSRGTLRNPCETYHKPIKALSQPNKNILKPMKTGVPVFLFVVHFDGRPLAVFNKEIPKLFFGQVVVWKPGVPKPTHVEETNGSLALPPKAARPKNDSLPEDVWFLALVPQASKKALGQKTTSGSLWQYSTGTL